MEHRNLLLVEGVVDFIILNYLCRYGIGWTIPMWVNLIWMIKLVLFFIFQKISIAFLNNPSKKFKGKSE